MSGARARAALALALLLALGGCGGGADAQSGGLVWDREPRVTKPPNLPRDRVLSGEVRNDSLERVDLEARDLRVVDAEGRRLPGNAAFLRTFVHGLFPPTREPGGGVPAGERLRTGEIARILPDRKVPLTVAWRVPPGREAPVRIDYGRGSLPIPAR